MGELVDPARAAGDPSGPLGHPWGDLRQGRRVSPDLRWLAGIIWNNSPQILVTEGSGVPPGRKAAERHLVVPNLSRPRFLVPLASRRAAWSAVASYNRLRAPATRYARALLGAAIRTGIAELVLQDSLTVSVAEHLSRGERQRILLSDYLRSLLGHDELVVAIGLRRPGPLTKPVLQVFSDSGRPLGYVKVGWNDVTRRLVRNEASFLDTHRGQSFGSLRIPTLIHYGRWADLQITITDPLPAFIRRYRPLTRVPPSAVTREIAEAGGIVEATFANSTYWRRTRRSISTMFSERPTRTSEIVGGFVRRLEDRYGDAQLLFGGWHGDWVPWNLAWHKGTLVAWDWEHSGLDVPLGFDVVNFLFQVSFAFKRRSLGESVTACRSASSSSLQALGIRPTLQPLVVSAYLLEMFLRYHAAQLAGAGVNDRFHPAILAHLASDLSND